MSEFIDLTGKKFNRWLVIKKIKSIDRRGSRYLCLCDCGKIKKINGGELRRGRSKSCGCYNKERASETCIKRIGILHPNYTHGFSKKRFYRTWYHLNTRCYNKNTPYYKNYGGRGIKCEWKNFTEFKEDMYESYLEHCKKFRIKNTSIDRINNDGNYCKKNCRWATRKEQKRNMRINKKYNNQCLIDLAKLYNINYHTLMNRIKRGWSTKKALETPLRK